jgi:hypothetical protein
MRAFLVGLLLAVVWPCAAWAEDAPAVSFEQGSGGLRISIGGQEVAEYVFGDEQIWRPYFKHLRTLSGRQVTRNSPPAADDLNDHPTMHPGLWLAFGDLNGADFWRNKAKVKDDGFAKPPMGGAGRGTFAVKNVYEADGKAICREECAISIAVSPGGYVLDWQSTFRGEQEFAFGDQEEMGLGVRVATPLAVAKGGEIVDSEGRKNGKQVWGQQAEWCRYGGELDGRQIGVVLMPEPTNFRRSWFHARDYGLVVANPFGQKSFTKGEASRVIVPTGKEFSLRFGVLVYDTPAATPPDVPAVYQQFAAKK